MGHRSLPRLGELMTALVRHLHDFSREVRLTEDEWMAAIEWLTAAGGISDDKRQELILTSDVLGLSTLVVQLNNTFTPQATPATVLGPFHIDGSPTAPHGFDMSDGVPGTPLFFTGRVTDTEGKPSPAPSWMSGRPTRKAPTSPSSPRSTRHACGPSTAPARTAPTASAPSRRAGTPFPWTAPSAI